MLRIHAGTSSLAAGVLLLAACTQPAEPPEAPPAVAPPAAASAPEVVNPEGLQGQEAARTLMARWKERNPGVDWEAEERRSRTFVAPHDNSSLLEKGTQKDGHPYRNLTARELHTWTRETELLVVAGSKVFHSADELDSTISVSCDMCHPNAANTHPETYPKFQTQIGKVVLLRDMINWCLEQAARAPQMDADDPRMRALEAYIISQRAGTPLAYGKH
jgi:cytochrome c553